MKHVVRIIVRNYSMQFLNGLYPGIVGDEKREERLEKFVGKTTFIIRGPQAVFCNKTKYSS